MRNQCSTSRVGKSALHTHGSSESNNAMLKSHGAVWGQQLPRGVPAWDAHEFDYTGPSEALGTDE